jgi:hypothetical protein
MTRLLWVSIVLFGALFASVSLNAQSGSWQHLSDLLSVTDIIVHPSGILATSASGGVYRSSDTGKTWRSISMSGRIALSPDGKLLAAQKPYLYQATGMDTPWGTLGVPSYFTYKVLAIAVSPTGEIYCGTERGTQMAHGGLTYSTDGGMNFSPIAIGDSWDPSYYSLSVAQNGHVFGATGTIVQWYHGWCKPSNIGLPGNVTLVDAVPGGIVLAGTATGLYRSVDSGYNWTPFGPANTPITAIGCAGSSEYIVGTNTGLYIFQNGIWNSMNSGLDSAVVTAIAVDSAGYVIVGTASNGFYRSTSSVTGIVRTGDNVVTGYALSPNYPNPFNPSTTIRVSLPRVSHVLVKLYNVLGEEVRQIMDEQQSPGNYDVVICGEGLPSGMYYCRMAAGSFSQTRPLMLVK